MAMSAAHATPWAASSCAEPAPAATLATAVPWEKPVPVLVGRVAQKLLGYHLAREVRMVLVDTGVDESDGDPGTRRCPLTLEQPEMARTHNPH